MSLTVDLKVTLPDGATASIVGTIGEPEPAAGLQPSAVAEWLGMIDPAELERIALEAESWIDGSYTAVILSILRGWASGRT